MFNIGDTVKYGRKYGKIIAKTEGRTSSEIFYAIQDIFGNVISDKNKIPTPIRESELSSVSVFDVYNECKRVEHNGYKAYPG